MRGNLFCRNIRITQIAATVKGDKKMANLFDCFTGPPSPCTATAKNVYVTMYVIKHICKETGFGLTGQIVPFQLFLIVLKDFCP